jgi:Raf kinase inhibitor-like YbhB/YbcL family protein
MKVSCLSKFPAVRAAGLILMVALLCSCTSMGSTMQGPVTAFRLTSPGLPDNGMLSPKNVGNDKTNPNCVGSNVSPPLQWLNAPETTRSFAIFMHDHAGRAGLGVSHWVAYGIPANVTSLAEGEVSGPSKNVVRGKGTIGSEFYAGPCPPRGNAPQHYVFTLIATDLEPDALKPGLTETELLESLKGHTLRAASLALRYAH